ncbi:hypothetical protein D3C72_1165850 [compost metagenome]
MGRARAQGRFTNGAAFNLGGTARHADDDPRAGRQHVAGVHHADELLEHLFGDREVGDNAVLHGPDGLDVAGNSAEHLLGFVADGLDDLFAVRPAFMTDCDHGGLIEHNALAADVNQRIGGTEVNRHIAGKITAQESEHGSSAKFWGELGSSRGASGPKNVGSACHHGD